MDSSGRSVISASIDASTTLCGRLRVFPYEQSGEIFFFESDEIRLVSRGNSGKRVRRRDI